MPLPVELPEPFHEEMSASDSPLIGAWVSAGSATNAEILAAAGFDFLLVDAEHSPYGLETVTHLLRATDGYGPARIVRVQSNDTVLIKQYLDLGAQNIMVPMVESASEAAAAVAAMHYPPRGVRGVGSALARSSRWNAVEGYLDRASETVNLTVQIESARGVANAAEIAAVDGVDQIFVGPADLAASLGHLGRPRHPEVVAAIDQAFAAAAKAGKPVGVNCFDRDQAREFLAAGASFVLVGADVQLLSQAARSLADEFTQKGSN